MVRMFLQTAWALAHAGRWDLLVDYFKLIESILAAPEATIIPGDPKDKAP